MPNTNSSRQGGGYRNKGAGEDYSKKKMPAWGGCEPEIRGKGNGSKKGYLQEEAEGKPQPNRRGRPPEFL